MLPGKARGRSKTVFRGNFTALYVNVRVRKEDGPKTDELSVQLTLGSEYLPNSKQGKENEK